MSLVVAVAVSVAIGAAEPSDREWAKVKPPREQSSGETVCIAKRVEIVDSNGTVQVPPPRRLAHLFWLHIPKTGTSFGNTVYRYACPRLPHAARLTKIDFPGTERGQKMKKLVEMFPPERWCPTDALATKPPYERRAGVECRIAGHKPIVDGRETGQRGVAMFRSSLHRLKSAYGHGKHAFGMPPEMKAALDLTVGFEAYARFDGISGCMSKMMIGVNCGQSHTLSVPDLVQAIERLHTALGFVGITEYWNTSMCLFHAQFGGHVDGDGFVNVRAAADRVAQHQAGHLGHLQHRTAATPVTHLSPAVSMPTDPELDAAEVDPADTVLYQAALRVFAWRLNIYGFGLPDGLADAIRPVATLCRRFPGTAVYCDERVRQALLLVLGAQHGSLRGSKPPGWLARVAV